MSDIEEITRRFHAFLRDIGGRQTEQAVTEMLITVGAYSATLIPIATSNLINSQFRNLVTTANGWLGEIGYGANYAGFVHDAPGTLRGTMTPRSPSSLGVVWGPSGEPQFLNKGVDLMLTRDVRRIFSGNYLP